MLIRLAKKDTDLYPNNPEKQTEIYERYKQLVLPLEEAEWIGLKPWEAMTKQKKIEEEKTRASLGPLKEKFAEMTLQRLQQEAEGELAKQDAPVNSDQEEFVNFTFNKIRHKMKFNFFF